MYDVVHKLSNYFITKNETANKSRTKRATRKFDLIFKDRVKLVGKLFTFAFAVWLNNYFYCKQKKTARKNSKMFMYL